MSRPLYSFCKSVLYFSVLFLISCVDKPSTAEKEKTAEVFLQILGTVQDGGSPHAGCKKTCCQNLFDKPDPTRMVVSLGLIDRKNHHTWLFDAGPDFARQQHILYNRLCAVHGENPDGIFITHAHIGHYAGLMYLGKEAMDAAKVNVYAMPRLKKYLESNGPWTQLVTRQNIQLQTLAADSSIYLSPDIQVQAFLVPHRDEFSETVGYKIISKEKSVLFIPDIDKWEKWDRDIVAEIKKVDYAFIDGTFYDAAEINNRDIKQIPHPFVTESMEKFKNLDTREKSKIYFIHLNHSNPLLDSSSAAYKRVIAEGYKVARFGEEVEIINNE